MSIFNKTHRQDNGSTTRGFYFGDAEAEAENQKGLLNHINYFEDYLSVLPKIGEGKFIIYGRKGVGKSSIAKYIQELSNSNNNNNNKAFTNVIRLSDLELEKIKQFDTANEFHNKEEVVIEWLILVRLITLIVQNKEAEFTSEYKPLKRFLEKNSGIVSIDKYEIREVIEQKKYHVSFEPLTRIFSGIFGKQFSAKTVKAPFYRLINPLKEIVKTVLRQEVNQGKDFVLLFDDLDIGFKATDAASVDRVVELIRKAKQYNTEIFKNTGAKVLVCIRNDMKRFIDSGYSDTAKIFSSYGIELKWYDHETYKVHENMTELKRFINRRIELNFKDKKISFDKNDPWSTLIENHSEQYEKTAFKYILDCTFYRPRDLVLFLKPLGINDFAYPLTSSNIKYLVGQYSKELISEIKNELSLSLTTEEIEQIFEVCKKLAQENHINWDTVDEASIDAKIQLETDEVLKILCRYSLLGLKEKQTGFVRFIHRDHYEVDNVNMREHEFILHNAIQNQFRSGRPFNR